jgi:anaerobic selenocysteine-containing dehydrogenase
MATRRILTSCTCDCPDTCSIIATVSDGRVTSIGGNPEFGVTKGFLCRKSHTFLKRLFSPDRVLYPLRRDGAGWKRVTWAEAAGLVADRMEAALRQYGPLSLFYFQEAGSIAALKLVNQRFFNLLGGGTFSSGSLCGGAGIAAQTTDFGVRTSHDPSDLASSRLIIIWGRNPAWANVHMLPILREARRHGALVVLIDPVRSATAKVVDLHIAPRPGADAFLALGLAKVIIEGRGINEAAVRACTSGLDEFIALARRFDLPAICDVAGVTDKEIRDLAWMYSHVTPAAIVGGWGVQRRRNGANIYRMMDALGALSGNIGVPGGGVSHGMDETRWFDTRSRLRDAGKLRREIPKAQTGRGLAAADNPPVKVAVVSGGNPLNQCPNGELVRKAFGAVEFKVVMDMFMTDTAQAADLVLPTTHFLEEEDVVASYWHNYVMPVNIAQARLGEEKTDLEIFALLGRRLGIGSKFPDDPAYFLDQLIAPLKAEGVSLGQIKAGPVRPPSAVDVPFKDRKFATASGRFQFVTSITPLGRPESAEYPYSLVSPHPGDSIHSQLGELKARIPEAHLSHHAAGVIGAGDGDEVLVETPQGSLVCVARITEAVGPHTVRIYEGSWASLGGSVNRLTSDELSDQGLCATYNDVYCRVRKAAKAK